MRRTLGISFATILIAAVACDEFTEGAPAGDAGAGEASTNGDGSPGDGGGVDAIADAGPSPPFCTTTDAAFCWSFDDESAGSALFGPRFTPRNTNKPVTLTPLALSAPNAMRAAGDGSSGPWMLTTTLSATSNISCTMSVFIEEITNQTELMTFALGPRTAAFLVEVLDDNAVKTSLLVDRTGPKRVNGLPNIAKKKWQKITLGGERVGDAGFILTAKAGDDVQVTADFSDAGTNMFAQPLVLEIGYFVLYGGVGAVRIDDVFCTYQ